MYALNWESWGLSFEMSGLVLPRGMRSNVLILFAGAAALASSPAIAQIRPIAAVPAAPAPAKPKAPAAKKPAPEALVPGNPDYAPAWALLVTMMFGSLL